MKPATQDVNAAGGGVRQARAAPRRRWGDTSTDTSQGTVRRFLRLNVGAILPGGASAVTFAVIDDIVEAGVAMLSPTNTVTELTDYPDRGLYWRDAPPDQLQGRILGETMLAESAQNLGVLSAQGTYGDALATNAERAFLAGGGTAATKISYQPTEAGINGGVARLKVLKPDAILAGGFENQQIIREMARQGLLPQRRSGERLYVSDAGVADWSEDFPRGTLTGVEGTIPGAKASPLLQAKLHHFDPTLANFEYSPESYDAVVLLALAATEAHSALGPDMADQLQDVSAGGVKCHSSRSCKRLIDARHNIDHDDLSGPIEFNEKGDPSLATIGIFQYGPDNTYRALTYPHQRTLR